MCTSQLRWKTKCCSCDGTNEQDLDAFVVHVKSFSVLFCFSFLVGLVISRHCCFDVDAVFT